ncbi:hypothetical protein TYRP_010498 [Tyrophagus putrescentiae]|nr:hypothetical protein TYRP_010498 [Tyrophagus putrescentiae]
MPSEAEPEGPRPIRRTLHYFEATNCHPQRPIVTTGQILKAHIRLDDRLILLIGHPNVTGPGKGGQPVQAAPTDGNASIDGQKHRRLDGAEDDAAGGADHQVGGRLRAQNFEVLKAEVHVAGVHVQGDAADLEDLLAYFVESSLSRQCAHICLDRVDLHAGSAVQEDAGEAALVAGSPAILVHLDVLHLERIRQKLVDHQLRSKDVPVCVHPIDEGVNLSANLLQHWQLLLVHFENFADLVEVLLGDLKSFSIFEHNNLIDT